MSTRWVCYCLHSTVKDTRTYVGATVNMKRRIRQHNGHIKGGAKATRAWRPWEIMYVVRGFRSAHDALSFEWHWKHATRRGKCRVLQRSTALHKLLSQPRWVNLVASDQV